MSVRIQQADDSESEIQEAIFCHRIMAGTRAVTANSCWKTNWRLAAHRWRCGRRQRKTSCRQIRCYRRPLMAWWMAYRWPMNYWHMYVTPTRSRTTLIWRQLPISEADRLFLSRLCGPGNIQLVPLAMARAISTPRGYAMSNIALVGYVLPRLKELPFPR